MKREIKNKVGLGGLTGLIIGGTIGSGIFALPATLTTGANPEGILIGWAIVAVGMFSLAGVYRNLTLQQPNIDDGIYGWSKHLFGDLCGFIANYGHGIGDAVGDASYLTVLFSAFGGFGNLIFLWKRSHMASNYCRIRLALANYWTCIERSAYFYWNE